MLLKSVLKEHKRNNIIYKKLHLESKNVKRLKKFV